MSLDFPDIPLARAIESNAERYKRLATQLSDSIVAFQDWLSCLPGNFNEKASAPVSASNPRRLFVAVVHSAGKRQLQYVFVDGDQPEPTGGWLTLTSGSIEVKAQAISLFPALMRRILMRQRIDVQRLENATDAFARFASRFGIESTPVG